MNTERGSERAVSGVGGMALALLIVAVVVQTARAADCTCDQCWPYYEYHYRKDGTTCKQFTGYQYNMCIRDTAVNKCLSLGYCPNPPSCSPLTGLRDCASDACNEFKGVTGSHICAWDCWNRFCSDTIPDDRCYDKKKYCKIGDATPKCSECKCAASGDF